MSACGPTERPHILLLNRWYAPEVHGGTETSLEGLARALVEVGVSVSVICETRHLPTGVSDLDGIAVHRYTVSTPPQRLWFAAATTNCAHIARNLRTLAPSVPHQFVIARMPEFAAAAARVMPRARITYWSPGGPDWFGLFQGRRDLTHRERFWNKVDSVQNSAIYTRAVTRSQVVVAETEQVKAEIVRRYRVPTNKVVVRGNGVDVDKFKPGSRDTALLETLGVPPTAPVVVGVGRLEPMKNFSFLLRGFAAMKGTGAHLLLVGEGTERGSLEALARTLGIADRVRLVGWRNDVERFLVTANAFVLPSVYEPYGNAFTEALAGGVPSIGLRNGPQVSSAAGDHIVDGVNGFLVDHDDAAALGQRLDTLACDQSRRLEMSAAARRLAVERYNWRRVALEFLEDFGLAARDAQAMASVA